MDYKINKFVVFQEESLEESTESSKWTYAEEMVTSDHTRQFYLNCMQEPVQELSEQELGSINSDLESDGVSIISDTDDHTRELDGTLEVQEVVTKKTTDWFDIRKYFSNFIFLSTVSLAIISIALSPYFSTSTIKEDDVGIYEQPLKDVDVNSKNYDVVNPVIYCKDKHKNDGIYREINIKRCKKCFEKSERNKQKSQLRKVKKLKDLNQTDQAHYLKMKEEYLKRKEEFLIEKEQQLYEAEIKLKREHGKYKDDVDNIKKNSIKKVQGVKKDKKQKDKDNYKYLNTQKENLKKENKNKENKDKKLKENGEKKSHKHYIIGDHEYYKVEKVSKHWKRENNDKDSSETKSEEKILKEKKKHFKYVNEEFLEKERAHSEPKQPKHSDKKPSDKENLYKTHREYKNQSKYIDKKKDLKNKTFDKPLKSEFKTIPGYWYSELGKGRFVRRKQEHQSDWVFDRSRQRKEKRKSLPQSSISFL